MSYSVIRLPRLPLNWDKQPQLFERYWDEAMTNLENAINEILSLPAIQAAVLAANAAAASANAAAAAANTAATNAQATADSTASDQSLSASGVINESAQLQASSTGNITIGNHDRAYGNPTLDPTASVVGATTASGFSSPDFVYVYYHDSSRSGGAVTYLFSNDPADAIQTGNTHSIGVVQIPAALTDTGSYTRPSGVPQ